MITIRETRIAAVTLSATLLLTACGAAPGDGAAGPMDGKAPSPAGQVTAPTAPASTPAAPPATAPVTTPATVPAALKFTATTLNGDAFHGAGLAGKPVVFWFWAPWCTKCRSEAPAVRAAAGRHKDVTFVGVAGLDTEAAMKEFVQRTGTGNIVQLSDAKGAVWTRLGVSAQSTFVFMKPDGSTEKASGPLDEAALTGHLRKLQAG
ncbi:redoxin domain-containing protein [Nonomuraea indica]|uniref:redoxin domain-containing protein n=1 Tax=Nonomuraea indica TaxID=1581193 RepID=UPI000C7E1789|nr:redoxin domain-containing protein [Nonomuraea indica]